MIDAETKLECVKCWLTMPRKLGSLDRKGLGFLCYTCQILEMPPKKVVNRKRTPHAGTVLALGAHK